MRQGGQGSHTRFPHKSFGRKREEERGEISAAAKIEREEEGGKDRRRVSSGLSSSLESDR